MITQIRAAQLFILGLVAIILSLVYLSQAGAQQIVLQSDIDGGRMAFVDNGCGECHGENAEGTDSGPALAGVPAVRVRQQVRVPVGNMPPSAPSQITNMQLEQLTIYFSTLPGADTEAPINDLESVEIRDEIVMRYWISLFSLLRDDAAEARYQLETLSQLIEGDHLARLQQIIADMEVGNDRIVVRALQDTLAGIIVPDISPSHLHLAVAQVALLQSKAEEATHDLEKFIEIGGPGQTAAVEQALQLVQSGNLLGASDALASVLDQ